MNETIIKKLCQKWLRLSEDERAKVRSVRARQGISCGICGKIGYFTQICPCQTPSSTEVATSKSGNPPVAVFWGSSNQIKTVDIGEASILAKKEKERLEVTDKKARSYDYFQNVGESYHSNIADLTLFQVLRKLIRYVHELLLKNAVHLESKYDRTILMPPDNAFDEKGARKALMMYKDYQPFLYKKEAKQEVAQKGKASKQLTAEKACNGSIYSNSGWRSTISIDDSDALSLAEPRSSSLPPPRATWHSLQAERMHHHNDGFEHLVHIVGCELKSEHLREGRLLTCPSSERSAIESKIWCERFDAADRIIQTMLIYKISSEAEDWDYFVYGLKQWKGMNRKHRRRRKAVGSDVTRPRREGDGSSVGDQSLSLVSSQFDSVSENDASSLISSINGESILDSSSIVSSSTIADQTLSSSSTTATRGRNADETVQHRNERLSRLNAKKKSQFIHAELRDNVVEGSKVMHRYELPALIDISTAYRHRSVDVKLNPQATAISSKIIDDLLTESSGAFSKKMLPLYYRYTQLEDTPLEVNDGVTYEELSQDRRVSTLFSRPLLNFVPKVKRSKVTGVAVSAVAGATQTATPLRKHTVIETSRKYDSLRCSKEKSFASFLESKNKGFAP